jgi:hypothetical protein
MSFCQTEMFHEQMAQRYFQTGSYRFSKAFREIPDIKSIAKSPRTPMSRQGFGHTTLFGNALQRFAFNLKHDLSLNALKSLISGSVK